MITCAIYPRKSKADDKSQSMEVQIEMCTDYLDNRYGKGKYKVLIYDGDYGITGHSVKKRKDFQKMMKAVNDGIINIVCIQRFDRIARNTRDFCNMYHAMEQVGCELVSVSQQIDTTTPYGKKFMYDLASAAELEWALNSERRKDVNKYAMLHGKCNLSPYCLPLGFKAEIVDGVRRMVHDHDTEQLIYDLIECLDSGMSHIKTLCYINDKYNKSYSHALVDTFRRSTFYYGSYRDNDNYCEPYLTKEHWEQLAKRKDAKVRYHDEDNKNMLFTGLLRCPVCGTKLEAQVGRNKGYANYHYYRCHKHAETRLCPFKRNLNERKIESYLIENVLEKLNAPSVEITAKTAQKKKDTSKYKEELKRLNNMYQKGRIDEDEYDKEYDRLTELINEQEEEPKQINYDKIKESFPVGWVEIYNKLTKANKKRFWLSTIEEIKFDENLQFTDIIFLNKF